MAGAHAVGGIPNAVHACVLQRLGVVRIVGADGVCRTPETAVHWSIVGPQGPQGDPGPQGPAGVLGSFDELAGLPCTAPGGQEGRIVVTYRNGVATLRCRVPGVRFIDNGDSTITDMQTGLMWEKKNRADGVRDANNLHDVDNLYTWCVATGDATFEAGCQGNTSSWIGQVNGRLIVNPNEGGFAGYSDWRLPTLAELRTIVDTNAAGCGSGGLCIDPIFGPTASSNYWSASTHTGSPTDALVVDFFIPGFVGIAGKNFTVHVRAVRGGW